MGSMGRRSPFESDGETGFDTSRKSGGTTQPARLRGVELAGQLPPPPSSARRDRGWEKDRRSDGYCQVGYRHVPVEARDRIKAIAGEWFVPADEVGRLLLEAGLAAFERGEVVIAPTLEAGKLTLFPEKVKK